MKQIFILFLLWFGLSLSAQDQISLLFVGDLMQHQAQIDAARQGDGYNYNDCFRHVKKEISEAEPALVQLDAEHRSSGSQKPFERCFFVCVCEIFVAFRFGLTRPPKSRIWF